ncbi:prepilin-type N-terminal cleavage/methylation domain-containing protein, partial [Klebsiella pneumoniae]
MTARALPFHAPLPPRDRGFTLAEALVSLFVFGLIATMIGAVLNTLNVRLDAEAIAFMLQHGEAKVVIADREFYDVIHAAIGMLDHPPLVIDVDDPEYGEGQAVSDLDYEAFLAEGDPEFA